MATITWGNPYTHEEHSRESIPNKDHKIDCAWCGNTKKTMYRYDNLKGAFCSKGCCRDYHNLYVF